MQAANSMQAHTASSIDLWLDGLTAVLQQHETAPDDLNCSLPFSSSCGPCSLVFRRGGPVSGSQTKHPAAPASSNSSSGDDEGTGASRIDDQSSAVDHYLSTTLQWQNRPQHDVKISLSIHTLNGSTPPTVLRHSMGFTVHSSKPAVHSWEFLKYSQLRRAVLSSGRLQAAIIMISTQQQAAADDQLLVEPAQGASFSAGAQLGGSFTDAMVRAGTREFKVHRVVLAACSPVLRRMLEGGMQEAQTGQIVLRDADPAAVELLLQHVYAAPIQVPLFLAPALCMLADQYQLQSDLAQQLQMWLSAVTLQPATLSQLLQSAYLMCHSVFHNMSQQAASLLNDQTPLDSFKSWPFNVLKRAIALKGDPMTCYVAAEAWMAANADSSAASSKQQSKLWGQLLASMDWCLASQEELMELWERKGSHEVPGLAKLLFCALHDLFTARTQEMEEALEEAEEEKQQLIAKDEQTILWQSAQERDLQLQRQQWQGEVQQREQALLQREQQVQQREHQVEQREQQVQQREVEVQQREQQVEQREHQVQQREQQVQQREHQMQYWVQQVQHQERQVQQREHQVLQWVHQVQQQEQHIIKEREERDGDQERRRRHRR